MDTEFLGLPHRRTSRDDSALLMRYLGSEFGLENNEGSTFNDVNRQSTPGGFFVMFFHVIAGGFHGLDDLIQ